MARALRVASPRRERETRDLPLKKRKALRIVDLLQPHWKAMTLALVGAAGVTATDLLEPWPIKIVVDFAIQSKEMQAG